MLVMRRLAFEYTLSEIALHPDAFVSCEWDTGRNPVRAAIRSRKPGALWCWRRSTSNRGDLHSVLEWGVMQGTVAFEKNPSDIDNSGLCRPPLLRGRRPGGRPTGIGADGLTLKVRDHLLGARETALYRSRRSSQHLPDNTIERSVKS